MEKQTTTTPKSAAKAQGYSKNANEPDAVPDGRVPGGLPSQPLKAAASTNDSLVAGPDEGKSELIAPPATVRIRAVSAIDFEGVRLAPGQEADVPESVAAEFCDRKFQGAYAFGGERGDLAADRHLHARAVRLP